LLAVGGFYAVLYILQFDLSPDKGRGPKYRGNGIRNPAVGPVERIFRMLGL